MNMKKSKQIKHQVLNFNVLLTEEEWGGYSVSVPTLPGCYSQGETTEEATQNIREAIELYLQDESIADIVSAHREKYREFILPVEVYVA